MARKSFDTAKAELEHKSVDFEMGGETFAVPLPLAGMLMLDMASVGTAEGAAAVAAFGSFLEGALGEREFARFHAMAIRERKSLDDLLAVVSWVIEEGTGVPTQQQPDSEVSSSNGTNGSLVAATAAG